MKVSATDCKNNFGKYLKKCDNEDIFITKNDKIIAKLVSFKGNIYNDHTCKDNLFVAEGNASYNYPRRKMTYEEFMDITEGNEERYELIEGDIYLLTSPGVTHQLIHANLYEKLILWFKGKKCQVFSAPFDVTLYIEETDSKNVVQPDLLVTCDHKETTNSKDRYMGIPSLVVEIISKNAISRDMVTKLNVYLQGCVSEYWIVDPQESRIIQYYFKNKQVSRLVINNNQDILKSFHFDGLEFAVCEVFT